MSIVFFAVTIEQKKRKIMTSMSQRNKFTSEIKQQKQNEINIQATIMKRMFKKREMSTISTISHSSSQKTLVKWEEDVIVKSNDQKMIEIIDAQKISQTTSTKEAKTKEQLWVNELSYEYYNTMSTSLERT